MTLCTQCNSREARHTLLDNGEETSHRLCCEDMEALMSIAMMVHGNSDLADKWIDRHRFTCHG